MHFSPLKRLWIDDFALEIAAVRRSQSVSRLVGHQNPQKKGLTDHHTHKQRKTDRPCFCNYDQLCATGTGHNGVFI